MFGHVLGSRASKHVVVVQEEQPPPLREPSFLLLSVTSGIMEYPFDWFRSAALVMFLSHFLLTPSLLALGGGLERVLMLCQSDPVHTAPDC